MPFSSFRQMSSPVYSTIFALIFAPEASGEVRYTQRMPVEQGDIKQVDKDNSVKQ